MNVIQQQVFYLFDPLSQELKMLFADEAHLFQKAHDYVESMTSVYSTHRT
jgi:hypothetical protein